MSVVIYFFSVNKKATIYPLIEVRSILTTFINKMRETGKKEDEGKNKEKGKER